MAHIFRTFLTIREQSLDIWHNLHIISGYMTTTTTLRSLVDRELANRGTSLEEFITEAENINKAAEELPRITGIPISRRTIYRWAADLKVAS